MHIHTIHGEKKWGGKENPCLIVESVKIEGWSSTVALALPASPVFVDRSHFTSSERGALRFHKSSPDWQPPTGAENRDDENGNL